MQHVAEARGLLGDLCPGQKKLDGKSFYLDSVKGRPMALIVEAITLLGGRVESFLHKDVSFVISGSRENTKVPSQGTKTPQEDGQRPAKQKESCPTDTHRPPACGSRGKALLEKAMRNTLLRGNSVLANAQSWGVDILHVDDVLSYLKQLTRESLGAKRRRTERSRSKQQQPPPHVKASALRSPYLKVEDRSRRYRPLQLQSLSLPSLCYTGRFSPFEREKDGRDKSRRKRRAEDVAQGEDVHTPLSRTPSPWRPRRKDLAYCECCQQAFAHLEDHLGSDGHRHFVLDSSNYSLVDQLMANMQPTFHSDPTEEEPKNSPSPPVHDVCVPELELLTDAETERTVQTLLDGAGAPEDAVLQPPCGVSPSSLAPAAPPADNQRFSPSTEVQSCSYGPDVLSPDPVSPTQQEPRSGSPRPPDDLYDLPPVLSPQVLYPSPHSPYSSPPVLSPQQYLEDQDMDGDRDAEVPDSVPPSVSSAPSPFFPPFLSALRDGSTGHPEGPSGMADVLCPHGDLQTSQRPRWRSRSLPQLEATTQNPKKRRRCSSSSEQRLEKRRRTSSAPSAGEVPEWCGRLDGLWTDEPCSHDALGRTCAVVPQMPQQVAPALHMLSVDTPAQKDAFVHTGCVPDIFQQPSWLQSLPPDVPPHVSSSPDCPPSLSRLSSSFTIDPSLIPDPAAACPSSSDPDWDSGLLCVPPKAPPPTAQLSRDLEILQRSCSWTQDNSYETHLRNVLQPSAPPTLLCGDETDVASAAFSRTVVPVVEVQH